MTHTNIEAKVTELYANTFGRTTFTDDWGDANAVQHFEKDMKNVMRTTLTSIAEEARGEAVRDCKLNDFEIREIVQETIGAQYQKRFNENLDYDQWAGIRDEMDICTRKIAEKINERVELNNEALTPTNHTV